MIIDKCKIYWQKGLIPCLVIVSVFIYLLNLSWLRWGSLLIDTGRELYIPRRLLSGSLLYRDIFYEHGPFSPYFNALLCKIFGIHIRSFIVSGILASVLTSFFLYRISRIFLKIPFATFSVITFLFVFAFGQHYEAGIFNYIIPYSYAAVYSMVIAIMALFFYYRVLMEKKKIYSYLCSFFIAMALLTKIEIGIAIVISICIGIGLDFKGGYGFRKICKKVALYCLFPIFGAVLVYGLFEAMARETGHHIIDSKVFSINVDIKGPLISYILGTDKVWDNIIIMLKSAFYYLALSFVFFIVGWVLFLLRKLTLIKKTLIGIGVMLLIVAITILFQRRFFAYYMQYRCVPIICIALSIMAYRKYLVKNEKRFLFLAVFSIFSLLLLTRILLNVWASHYGFYLLITGMLCYYFFFLKMIPDMFRLKEVRIFYRFAFVILAILFIISHNTVSFDMYRHRTMEISSPRGKLRVRPGYYRYKKLLEYLRKETDPSASLVVFPEGLTLNFLSERENPMYQYSFLPLPFFWSGFESGLIKSIEDNRISYVVILRRDTSDYGLARFGMDYAQGIMRYLAGHYVVEQQFGPWPFTSTEFSLVLLRRTETPDSNP